VKVSFWLRVIHVTNTFGQRSYKYSFSKLLLGFCFSCFCTQIAGDKKTVIEENIERKDARLQSQQDADLDREKIFAAKVNVQGGVQ